MMSNSASWGPQNTHILCPKEGMFVSPWRAPSSLQLEGLQITRDKRESWERARVEAEDRGSQGF